MIRFSLTRLCACAIALVLLPCGRAAALDNSIHDVGVCELLDHSENFDAQIVRIRGQLNFEFEGDHVNDNACRLNIFHTGIWWDYAGENVWPGSHDARRIRALTSPIEKDAQFALFEARTHEHRKIRPDGEPCDSNRACAYYEVVATFTGRFFAGQLMPGGARRGGYGHMGCCHLFVIEQISDVDPNRTPVPDDDAKFSCQKQVWQSEYFRQTVPDIEGHLAANKRFLADQMRTHGDDSLIEAMDQGLSPFAGMTGLLKWSSPDLLTTYRIRFPHPKGTKKQPTTTPSAPSPVEVSREECRLLAD